MGGGWDILLLLEVESLLVEEESLFVDAESLADSCFSALECPSALTDVAVVDSEALSVGASEEPLSRFLKITLSPSFCLLFPKVGAGNSFGSCFSRACGTQTAGSACVSAAIATGACTSCRCCELTDTGRDASGGSRTTTEGLVGGGCAG